MAIFKCNVCGYLYDEAGNTLFSALADDWRVQSAVLKKQSLQR